MRSVRLFQAQAAWYLDQSRLYLVSGIFLHMGVIWLNPVWLAISLILLPRQKVSFRSLMYFSQGVLIDIYYYAPPYYLALDQLRDNAPQLIFGLGIMFISAWVLWSYLFMLSHKASWHYILPTSWLVYSHKLWEFVGIGFYDISPIMMNTPWEGLITVLGQGAIWVLIWSIFALRHVIFRYYVLLLACIAPVISYQDYSNSWLNEINIYGESQGFSVDRGDAIISKRIYTENQVYHASIGIGDVVGTSIKQHLVPFIESGYDSKIANRQFIFKQHNFLVLICNDALFTDWLYLSNVEAIIVLTHLADLQDTPLLSYFSKKLAYTSLLKEIPVMHVDQDFTGYYSFT